MSRNILCSILAVLSTTFLMAESAVPNEKNPFPEVISANNFDSSLEAGEMLPFLESIHSADDPYLYRIHNDAYYHIVAFSDNGDVVQLHDASKWSVHPSQSQMVLYWVRNNDIFIKPRSSCFSSYQYVLYNRTTQQAVEVNLITPPLPRGDNTFRIVNIEPFTRMVQLSDNTAWVISPDDDNFPYWQIGQRVLIGVNNHWRTAPLPNILINVDLYGEPYSEGNFYGNAIY